MDRVKYKEKAKKMIEGNKWYLWKPLVMFSAPIFILTFVILLILGIIMAICGAEVETITNVLEQVGGVLGSITGVVETVFMYGYAKYCLDFVRGKNPDWREPFQFIKTNFIPVLFVSAVLSLMVIGGTILLIVPGIIIAIGHSYIQEVYADNSNLKTKELLTKSWAVTNGHKMDLFILGLSFLGWVILAPFTIFILAIWLIPYMNITFLLVYEDLTKGTRKEEKVEKEEPKKEIQEAKVTKPEKTTTKKATKKTTNKKKKN